MASGQEPSAEDVRTIEEELTRVLSSPALAGSGRLCAFLEFVVRKTLAGQSEDIKEYTIGTEVFDRPNSFDPRIDTIVRVQASKLRSRLTEYYAGMGAKDPIVIELARGSYVPIFHTNAALANGEPALSPAERTDSPVRWIRRGSGFWTAVAATCILVLAIIYGLLGPHPSPRPEVLRFTLQPPENTAFFGPASISPDGRNVLGIVMTPLGSKALWLRPLAAASGQVLPGTEGAGAAFWSEDGRLALFWGGDNRLKKIDIATAAPPQAVPGPSPGFGAAWSRNGFLLMAREGAGIGRMAGTGETVSMVTWLDESHQEISHYWPQFLPDGRDFVYLAHSRNPAEDAIYAASLDGKRRKRLLTNESLAQYAWAGPTARTGYLLYVRERTLLARAFNPLTWELSGDPKVVIQDGILQLPYGVAAFSASATGVLVYQEGLGVGGQFAWFDRAGKQLGTIGPAGICGDPAISPNGKLIAFDFLDGLNRDIWTVEVATGHTRRLTFDPEVDHAPIWSADGSRIAFDSHRGSLGGLYVRALNGISSETLLLPWSERLAPEDWSRDGAFLAFSSSNESSKADIWILPLQGSQQPFPYLQTKAREWQAKFSPDGRWIAYASDESGKEEVYVQAFHGASTASGVKWLISSNGGSEPTWRADGRELFYLGSDYKVMAVDVNTKGAFTSGHPRPLFGVSTMSKQGPRNLYAASADGQQFLMRVVWQRNPPAPISVIVNWAAAIRD